MFEAAHDFDTLGLVKNMDTRSEGGGEEAGDVDMRAAEKVHYWGVAGKGIAV